jgi:hypothetical protein
MYQVPEVLLYLTSRRGKLKDKGRMRHAKRWAAEGQGSRMQLMKRHAAERFNPELKLPRLMSAKNTQPHHTTPARHLPATPRSSPARPPAAARARVWHTLDLFLTSQIKWNNSHHISQAKRPLDFQYGTICILHHYTP